MGDLAGDDTSPHEDGAREAVHQRDVARIADAVREVVDAHAALISRVVDDEWLEVVAVSGATHGTHPTGTRWPRADLARYLHDGEQRGRLHVTKRPGADDSTILLAPLHTNGGDLVGVLGTVGDVDRLVPGAYDLVELYADQARLALDLQHERHLLVEHLRLSDTAQSVLTRAAEQHDVPSLLAAVAQPVAAMMRAEAAWTCAELASGIHAEAASYPAGIAGRLGADICTLVEPMVSTCWSGDTTLSSEDQPLLGRIAGLVGRQRALLAAIGSGSSVRGAPARVPERGRTRPGHSTSATPSPASAAGSGRSSSSSRPDAATGISWPSCGRSTSTDVTWSPRSPTTSRHR